ncbi:RNA polymerase sigma factor [Nocardiopsis alba]|jgi:RNA polymerase sigma-70 factor (ECF subfamily)|uniref:Sigma-70 family RNA polymerase sigma factor n=2 Tax=Nocardiopsis alba TaxID=53437 RepID=A0ABV5DPN2_9ACTN|nr:sigma-70 family RNA polymerase sigma factor [Nocardiopsis alba]AFR07658.1 putative RNA polymerase sigma-C factor [Nocardiopsis alba ATCC BAA-2165]
MIDGIDVGRAPNEEHTDLSRLALNAGRGAPGAMDTLFTLTRDDVTRYIARRVDPGWVEDLTQETFSRAVRSLPRYAGRSPVRAWLLSVARHTVVDRYRAVGRTPRTDPVDDWERSLGATAASPDRFDEYIALLDLVDELPEDRRTAFVLTQVRRLSYAETAALTGVPVGTVRSRVARGRRDLIRLLREAA